MRQVNEGPSLGGGGGKQMRDEEKREEKSMVPVVPKLVYVRMWLDV